MDGSKATPIAAVTGNITIFMGVVRASANGDCIYHHGRVFILRFKVFSPPLPLAGSPDVGSAFVDGGGWCGNVFLGKWLRKMERELSSNWETSLLPFGSYLPKAWTQPHSTELYCLGTIEVLGIRSKVTREKLEKMLKENIVYSPNHTTTILGLSHSHTSRHSFSLSHSHSHTSHHHPWQSPSHTNPSQRRVPASRHLIPSPSQQRRPSVVPAQSSIAVFKFAAVSAIVAGSFPFVFPPSQPSFSSLKEKLGCSGEAISDLKQLCKFLEQVTVAYQYECWKVYAEKEIVDLNGPELKHASLDIFMLLDFSGFQLHKGIGGYERCGEA
ncbi:hypothetical protein PIB30_008055 [Stylosanthes scabra]|uniref:Uncharacterized protein n=1 Tax=Stylosanthes scabra TaxID=79078 RepID=A0ABU6W3E9_9FABA|nr:hypothetical protein [Stylosanthes scabra]